MNKEFYKYMDENTPREIKLLGAKGALPLQPEELIEILYFLIHDPDREISKTAQNSLRELPEKLLNIFLSSPRANPQVLDYLARNNPDKEWILEGIVMNKNVSDETLLYLAPFAPERIAELIANNHYRLERNPNIVEGLLDNPNLTAGIKEKIAELFITKNLPTLVPKASAIFPAKLVEEEELPKEKRENLYKEIQYMSVAKKIKLALLGNKEARSILIKDPNKVVATSVLKNPKLTESEIISIAQSRNVCEEVIRIIANQKEWTRNYQVRLALVNNPKTPVQSALKFLHSLTSKDLSIISRNKNIPALVTATARKLLMARNKTPS